MIANPVPDMSNAQHRALTRAVGDAEGYVARAPGVSSSTLFGLAKPQYGGDVWLDLVYSTTEGNGVKTTRLAGGKVRQAGRRALQLVDEQRAQAARNAEVRRTPLAARIDPFELVRLVSPAELVIDF